MMGHVLRLACDTLGPLPQHQGHSRWGPAGQTLQGGLFLGPTPTDGCLQPFWTGRFPRILSKAAKVEGKRIVV